MQRVISELGKAIKGHRARFDLSQDEVAEAMKVSRSWIAGMETGKAKGPPDPLFVARAAVYLRISRREAFQKAGYTAGFVLELFGDEVTDGEPVSELQKLVADLSAVTADQKAVKNGLLQALEVAARLQGSAT